MAKIKIVGDAIVVVSDKTLEDIKTLEKYNPKALSLYETDNGGKKEEVFRIASTTRSAGSINEYGATFGSATHDGDGFATITLTMPSSVSNAKDYVAEEYGVALMQLNKVEEQFEAALADISTRKAAIQESIEVV